MFRVAQLFLLKACHLVGSQARLATLIGVFPGRVNQWINRGDRISYPHILAIEEATGGHITRYQLAPDIRDFENHHGISSDRQLFSLFILYAKDRPKIKYAAKTNEIDAIRHTIFKKGEMSLPLKKRRADSLLSTHNVFKKQSKLPFFVRFPYYFSDKKT